MTISQLLRNHTHSREAGQDRQVLSAIDVDHRQLASASNLARNPALTVGINFQHQHAPRFVLTDTEALARVKPSARGLAALQPETGIAPVMTDFCGLVSRRVSR